MFSRRWLINYLLVFLIILFTWIGNRFGVKTGYQQQPDVSAISAAEIQTVQIKTADSTVALSRQGDGWRIDSPIRWPADGANVERLIAIVDAETDSQLDAADIDLSTIGLDLPKALLRLDDTQVSFGATNNIGERRYVKIGERVYLLPDVHLPFIAQGLLSVLDRRLLPAGFELSRLGLPGLALERGGDGGWHSPAEPDHARERLQALVDNWQQLPASRVQRYRGTDTPRQKIEALLADGSRLEFFLMSIDPEIVIANPATGFQYHFGADFYYQLSALKADADTP